jgi:hypothetical protein
MSTRFCVWCSVVPSLIIPMIIQTIEVSPPGLASIDGTHHLSRAVRTRTERSDAGHPSTDLVLGAAPISDARAVGA